VGETGHRVMTEHLLLRPPAPADHEAYLGLFLQPRIGEWLRPTPLPPLTEADIGAMLGDDLRHWGDFGFGPWALLARGHAFYVGRAGLRWTTVEEEAKVEMAWTVAPDRQGEGLATEAALAAVEVARSQRLGEIIALTLPDNRASRRVAEKAGMSQEGKVVHAGLDHVLYRLALA
jgi:ribosomal-protein-alanine N-acetyltransferase